MKIVIIGGGIGGLVCAIACRQEVLDVTVLEQAESLLHVGAGIQIPPNSSRVARQLGYLPQLIERGVVLSNIDYRRYADGKLLYDIRMDEKHTQKLGGMWLTIHRADYHRVLWETAEKAGAALRLGARVESLASTPPSVTLVGGDVVAADVIVGADASVSPIFAYDRSRTMVSHQDFVLDRHSPPIETGDMAYRATFGRNDLLSLEDMGIKKLIERNAVTCWLGPGKHAVFYPIANGEVYNLVLGSPDDMDEGVHEEQGSTRDMTQSFEGWDDRLTTMISCISHVLKWKLFHHRELPVWTKGSVALLGDACHPSLPYQAQGAAMATEDGAVLGKLLGLLHKSKPHESEYLSQIPELLKLYESLRKSRTTTNVQGALSNRIAYHLPDGPKQVWRDATLAAASRYAVQTEFKMADENYKQAMLGFDSVGDCISAYEDWDTRSLREGRASI